jgi:hypothetical protein
MHPLKKKYFDSWVSFIPRVIRFLIRIVGLESILVTPGMSATSGLLYLPRVIMRMENLVEWRLAGDPKYSQKICPSATLSTTNPTWPDPGTNPGRRGGKPATNRLNYDADRVILRLGFLLESFYPQKTKGYIKIKTKYYVLLSTLTEMIWIEPGTFRTLLLYVNHCSIGGGRTQQCVNITITNNVKTETGKRQQTKFLLHELYEVK